MLIVEVPLLTALQNELPNCATLIDLLEHRAQIDPNKVIYEFISDSGKATEFITNGQLAQQARNIAICLSNQGIKLGDRVLLIYPPGLELIAAFFGCLYAGAIAVPVYPPVSAKLVKKIKYIVKDAKPAMILSTQEINKKIKSLYWFKKIINLPLINSVAKRYWQKKISLTEWDFDSIPWLSSNTIDMTQQSTWQKNTVDKNTIAFLQYTSGSTGDPKGVMASHGNLMHNLNVIKHACQLHENSQGVSWLPPYHDMGLIAGILAPLYANYSGCLISPMAFLNNPLRWLQLISDKKATITGSPNFAFDYCVDKINRAENLNLDLRHLEVIANGAEPLHVNTLNRFYEAFKKYGLRKEAIYPCYGLAEATVFISGNKCLTDFKIIYVCTESLKKNLLKVVSPTDKTATTFVSCGYPYYEIQIVNPDDCILSQPNEIGEIWVRGEGITQGYWQKPKETSESFHATRRDDSENKFYLRTGDMGFILDGNLYVTGRIKDLIIIYGQNHYPQDIEYTVAHSHPNIHIGSCIAFPITYENEERLGIVCGVVPEDNINYSEMIDILCESVANKHQLAIQQIDFVAARTLPKTTSGKIQRRLCKEMLLNDKLSILHHWQAPIFSASNTDIMSNDTSNKQENTAEVIDKIEYWLQQWIARHVGCSVQTVSTTRAFIEYGIDSIAAIQLMHDLSEKTHLQLEANLCWEYPSARKLANFLLKEKNNLPALIEIKDSKVELELSFGQERLWFLKMLSSDVANYNIGAAFKIEGALNTEYLQQACDLIVQRHTVLRSVIKTIESKPLPIILSNINTKINIIETTEIQSTLQNETMKPYDLELGPLIRFLVIKLSAKEHIFLCAAHHIIFDGWSINIFMQELFNYYEEYSHGGLPKPKRLVMQYYNYAAWQRKKIHADKYLKLLQYWTEKLKDANKIIELPTDNLRQAIPVTSIKREKITLNDDLAKSLSVLCKNNNLTPFVFFITAFQLLLYRYSSQNNFIIGVPVAGRPLPQLRDLLGYFVNTLPINLLVNKDQTGLELLVENHKILSEAYNHQDIILPELLKHLNIHRELSREPLFQVMFVMQNSKSLQKLSSDSLSITPCWHEPGQLPYDIVLEIIPVNETFQINFSYNAMLFEKTTIERYLQNYQAILEILHNSPEKMIHELSLLDNQEKNKILKFNKEKKYLVESTLHQVFENQVDKTPSNPAIIFENNIYSYQVINTIANQLAHYLIATGIKSGNNVVVYMRRTHYLPIALLAISKIGATYVPIDDEYPAERVAYILQDVKATAIITNEGLKNNLSISPAKIIILSTLEVLLSSQPTHNPNLAISPEQIAYIIYTSGSTGRPKGVMVRHRGLLNCIAATNEILNITKKDKLLSIASVSFDVSMFDMCITLLHGATIVLADNETCKDPKKILTQILNHTVTILSATPSILKMLLLLNLKKDVKINWLSAGEALSSNLAVELLKHGKIYNFYGPTENSIGATITNIDNPNKITIGPPLNNINAYILDSDQNICPIGVLGELYIGGIQVSAGYLNMEALTAERFTVNPFNPSEKMYKSGDICRWLADGKIEYLGRSDHQVKIRGCRIELGEIENVLKEDSTIKNAVVTAQKQDSDISCLVAYIVPKKQLGNAQINHEILALRKKLAARLPAYMIPSGFIFLAKIPINASGKVDTKALPHTTIKKVNTTQYAAPTSTLQTQLVDIWCKVLKMDAKNLSIEDNFFEIGGDSILSIQICIEAEKLGLYFTVQDIFQNQTIIQLAKIVKTAPTHSIKRNATGDMPLSPIQTWFFEQTLNKPEHWNQSLVLQLSSTIVMDNLEKCLDFVFNHHTAFGIRFNKIAQNWQASYQNLSLFNLEKYTIKSSENFSLEFNKYSNMLGAKLKLSDGPLYKVALISGAPDGELRLLIIIHHLIVDGVSWRILINEITEAYQQISKGNSISLLEEKNTYKDWVLQLYDYANSEKLEREKPYWLSLASTAEFPIDNQNCINKVRNSATLTFSFSDQDTVILLNRISATQSGQMLNTLLTGLLLAYHDWHGGKELLLELESHGREELFEGLDINNTIGWFTTIFPILLKLPDDYHDNQLSNLLTAIDTQLTAIPNNGIGYSLLRYLSKISSLRNELHKLATAKIVFNYLGQVITNNKNDLFKLSNEMSGLSSDPDNLRSHWLEINSIILNGKLTIHLTYCKEAYHKDNIETFFTNFKHSLEKIKTHYQHNVVSKPLTSVNIDNIIKLNQGDGKHILFCIHPIGGSVISYAKLANMLSPYFTVYGIQALNFHKNNLKFNNIEDMAAHYLLQINKFNSTQSHGLLGWSMGGLIALEMANQLSYQNKATPLLALIDVQDYKVFPSIDNIDLKFIINYIIETVANETDNGLNSFLTKKNKILLSLLKILPFNTISIPMLLNLFFNKTPGLEYKQFPKHLKYLQLDLTSTDPRQFPAELWINFLKRNHILSEMNTNELANFYEIYRFNFYATLAYRAKNYANDVVFLDSTKQTIANDHDLLFTNARKIKLPGTHFNIMRNDKALRIISNELLATLDENIKIK